MSLSDEKYACNETSACNQSNVPLNSLGQAEAGISAANMQTGSVNYQGCGQYLGQHCRCCCCCRCCHSCQPVYYYPVYYPTNYSYPVCGGIGGISYTTACNSQLG